MLKANGAGGAATDPILAGLTLAVIGYADSFNLASGIASGVDADTIYPITNAVTAALTPAGTQVTPAGVDGVWDSVTEVFTIGDTTGLAAGHFMRLNAGVDYVTARVATVVSLTEIQFVDPPFGASVSNVSFQVAWAYINTVGQGVYTSGVDAVGRYFKFEGATAAGNRGELNPIVFYMRDAPSNLMVFNGGAPTGWRTNKTSPDFEVLPTWPNRGGIGSLELGTPTGITWWDGTTGEKHMYEVLNQGTLPLRLTGLDGSKSAAIIARGRFGSANTRSLGNVSGVLDTAAPDVAGEVSLV